MKIALFTAALITTLLTQAQDSAQVDVNNNKIDELNERLNKLLGTSDVKTLDSTSIKLDIIMNDIREIKTELDEVKASLTEMQEVNQTTRVGDGKKLEEPTDSAIISESQYYLVLLSDRSLRGAKEKMNKIDRTEQVALVQNERQSWYHLILKDPITLTQAGQLTQKYRMKGYTDAWWTTGRKLTK